VKIPASEVLLLLALIIPVVGSFFIFLCRKYPNVREGITLITGIALFANVSLIASRVFTGERPEFVLAEPFSGFTLSLAVEPLGMLFALLASFLWIITSIYAIGYMRGHGEDNQTRFYIFFACSIASVMGVAFAGDLLTLFVFYEVLTLMTYPLVTHSGTAEARRSGRVYLGILISTSMVFFLLAVVWTALEVGTLAFSIGGIYPEGTEPWVLGLLLALFVFGIGKAAIMPFHRWLPAAMVAPTPVSALLHAVAVVKAGVFSILKICIYIFGANSLHDLAVAEWLSLLAGFTIIAASIVAMGKDNLKARLAYSTISQLSYVTLGALLGNSAAWTGASMHMVAHAFGKITLFFCAGAILVAHHKKNVSDLDGLGRVMPFTMGAFFIGSLSIAGLPPTAGMWSKWYLVLGTVDAGELILLNVLLLSTLLNVYYLVSIPIRGFFKPLRTPVSGIKEAPLPCLIAIGVTTTITVGLFIYPEHLFQAVSGLVTTW